MKQALKDISSEKPQLVKTARQLSNVDRVALPDDDVRGFQSVIGETVKSVEADTEFRAAWARIVDVMSVIAPVETREKTDDNGDVYFLGVASGSRRELRVQYCADGELRVKALWSASATVNRAMVVVDETYSL